MSSKGEDSTTRSGLADRAPWTPSSWRQYKIKQQPVYKDEVAVERCLKKVRSLPPLIHAKEIETLKCYLAQAAEGKRFLLQGGDCAERFIDCARVPIENQLKILLQMSLIIIWVSRVPTVRVARIAGQFAKPRTSPFETINGVEVPSYKGDNINDFDVQKREPDPDRMVEAYFHSAATINYIRSMIANGFADLHHPQSWTLHQILKESVKQEYETIIERITQGLDFLKVIHADSPVLESADMFTSHEGLLLNYEESLTDQDRVKQDHNKDKFYNLGAHFLWIGDRTRDIDGAHAEYFRGISNPIGVKVGPSMTSNELQELVKLLNPDCEAGRLALITRYGCKKVQELLPAHIQAVKSTGIPVVWVCDPCHGNTESTKEGFKTRDYNKMLDELKKTFEIHALHESVLAGVHLELTGANVTECTGGSPELSSSQLSTHYETFCDPRLNYTQSLDIAFAIAAYLKQRSS